MNDKPIPDRSGGGTFVYAKNGTFVEHIPPTKPTDMARTDDVTPASDAATTVDGDTANRDSALAPSDDTASRPKRRARVNEE